MNTTKQSKTQAVYDSLQKDIREYLSLGNNKLHFNAKAAKLKELTDEDIKLLLPIATLILNGSFHSNRNTLVSVSRSIAQEIKQLPSSLHNNSIADEINIGMFLLARLAEYGAVYIGLRRVKDNQFPTRHILVQGDGTLLSDLSDIAMAEYNLESKTGLLPALEQHDDWNSFRHNNGTKITSRGDNDYIESNLQQKHYDRLNYKQSIPWVLNKDMVTLINNLMQDEDGDITYTDNGKTHAPLSYMSEQPESKARTGKRILTQSICRIARLIAEMDAPFYHNYKYDYRGRVYPTSSLVHEQGDDVARGMIDFANKTKLGETGWDYLLSTTASHFGEDKANREDRKAFTIKHLDEFIKYGQSPMEYRGWMCAEKKMQFLRACKEIGAVKEWVDSGNKVEDFESGLVVSIDASTSGAQILSAITRDSSMGRHVNLVNSDTRGDLYTHMAEYTFKAIEDDVNCDSMRNKKLKTLERERKRNAGCIKRGVPYNDLKKYPNRPATFEQYEADSLQRIENLPAVREWLLSLDEKTTHGWHVSAL